MIYLDNNATTPLCSEALEAMMPFLTECWANSSSGYRFARRARAAVDEARARVAALLDAEPAEVVFTSGGTEASNAAIQSAISLHPDRRHLITAATEHEATLRPLEALAARGYELTVLPVDSRGLISLEDLAAALRPAQTALVSLMWANNETGVVQPVAQAAALAQEAGVLFHCDAVQAAGKTPLRLSALPVHYASFSAHKFHGPKGVGALYVSGSVRFAPSALGGGQEGGRRSGTLNVPGIAGMGAAAAAALSHLEAEAGRLALLRDQFESGVLERIAGAHVHGAQAPRLPNTCSLRIDGVDAQGALLLLDNAGICVSTGSACATGSIRPSHVLTAMGLNSRQARETLRFSFSRYNTADDVARAVTELEKAVAKLRLTLAATGVT